jgi:hypothetical protein
MVNFASGVLVVKDDLRKLFCLISGTQIHGEKQPEG